MKSPPLPISTPTRPTVDRFSFSPVDRLSSAKVLIGGKTFIDFTSFDYFNFFQDPRLKDSLHQASVLSGLTCGASRASSGTSEEIAGLELALSRTFFSKTAVFFSSRQQAVFSLLTGLLKESDLIIYDEDSTAPVGDASFMVGATGVAIDLNKASWRDDVQNIVLSSGAKRIYFFAEVLSSVTGCTLDWHDSLKYLKQIGATLILDVSYSLGLIPPSPTLKAIYVGGLGFGLPGVGGFVCGDEAIESVRVNSKVLQIEAAFPPFLANFNRQLLNYLPELYLKTSTLLESVIQYKRDLKNLGLTLLSADDSFSPILSIKFPSSHISKPVFDKLISRGLLAARVAKGSIRSDKSIVRLNITNALTEADRVCLVRNLSELTL